MLRPAEANIWPIDTKQGFNNSDIQATKKMEKKAKLENRSCVNANEHFQGGLTCDKYLGITSSSLLEEKYSLTVRNY